MDSAAAIEATTALVAATQTEHADVRALGGVAVAMRCSSARGPSPLARSSYSDIDLVTTRTGGPILARILPDLGYVAERRFNALHGHRRMMFARADGLHLDVFVGEFVMCHRLDLSSRLAFDDRTVSLADLLLTKLQIAQLNSKDVTDTAALLLDHAVSSDEAGVNVDYIARLLAHDWGWWRTVTQNLRALAAHVESHLSTPALAQVRARLDEITTAVDESPKSLRWKVRAKAGDKLPWRDEPEESH